MSSLRTFILSSLLAASSFSPAARAALSPDLAITFASCVGRLSALMEHQWLFSDPESDRTERERRAMISLMEAVTRPDDRSEILNIRLTAKIAHAGLLRRSVFNDDPEDASWALARAEAEIGQCRALMLN